MQLKQLKCNPRDYVNLNSKSLKDGKAWIPASQLGQRSLPKEQWLLIPNSECISSYLIYRKNQTCDINLTRVEAHIKICE